MPGVLNKNKIPIHAAGIIETDVHKIRSIGNTLCTALLLSRFFKRFPVAVYRIPEQGTGPAVRACMVRAISVSKSNAGTACEIFLINLIEFSTTNSGQNVSHCGIFILFYSWLEENAQLKQIIADIAQENN